MGVGSFHADFEVNGANRRNRSSSIFGPSGADRAVRSRRRWKRSLTVRSPARSRSVKLNVDENPETAQNKRIHVDPDPDAVQERPEPRSSQGAAPEGASLEQWITAAV